MEVSLTMNNQQNCQICGEHSPSVIDIKLHISLNHNAIKAQICSLFIQLEQVKNELLPLGNELIKDIQDNIKEESTNCDKIVEEEGISFKEELRTELGLTEGFENTLDQIQINASHQSYEVCPYYASDHENETKVNKQLINSVSDNPDQDIIVPDPLAILEQKNESLEFPDLEDTKDHIIHEEPKQFSCTLCDKKYTQKHNLSIHKKTVHEGQKPFKCSTCDKSFTQSTNFKIHIKNVHEGQQNSLKCPTCYRIFTRSDRLKIHLKTVHEGQKAEKKSYKCSKCDKSFTQSQNVKIHLQTVHEKQRKFKCSTCDKTYTSSSRLKYHIQSVHEVCPYKFQCSTCDKNFLRLENLNMLQQNLSANTRTSR